MARNKGADIITSSIGSNNGCPEDPWSAATAAIVVDNTNTPTFGLSGSFSTNNGTSSDFIYALGIGNFFDVDLALAATSLYTTTVEDACNALA
ncbi:subtilisin-like protease [Marssonina coronariae]|uniref:Subtilisin-like protease n=1 Tax=Diplocarpon coronariae TaxID=2795749 RepID=A0A218YUS0_9HELO|nr:subtilisin-like protease [Marssonina coronariae]